MPASRAGIRCVLLGLLLAASAHCGACAHAPARDLPVFAGPGRLLLLLERAGAAEIVILDEAGARVLGPADVGGVPTDARFTSPNALLVLVEVAGEDEFGIPDLQLCLLELGDGPARAIGPPGRRYDPEPSPDGRWLAVGAELAGLGDSDLEIWSLAGEPERVAVRHQSLEEPRWRPDGFALVASVLMSDPESDDLGGGSFIGSSFSWPRMHRLRRDLGDPEIVWDGEAPDTLTAGGSLPLWWDARGLWARQNRGLVLCELPARSCRLIYATEETRRIVDGRAAGPGEAWLLSVEARDAFDRQRPDELVRISLESGRVLARWRAPTGTVILDLDWIADP